jgi:hypothetical protein
MRHRTQKLRLFSCIEDAPLPDPSSITTSLIVQLISVRATAAVAKSASTKKDAMHPWRTLKHPPKQRLALWSSAFWCIITQNHRRDQASKTQSRRIFDVHAGAGGEVISTGKRAGTVSPPRRPLRACRCQLNSRIGANPCRRATPHTVSPACNVSSTRRTFSL